MEKKHTLKTLYTAAVSIDRERDVFFQTVKTGAPNPVFHHAQPFFKLLTLLVEFNSGTMGPQLGLPNFIQIVLHKMWDVSCCCC